MRRRPPDRLQQVIRAALRVFAERGYRRTQMADVAHAMGVASGTLYGYVASKEALFHLVVDRAFLPEPRSEALVLPIPTPPSGSTLRRLRQRFEAEWRLPTLKAALGRRRVADAGAELAEIVRELYTLIERLREALVTLERSALDLPELAEAYRAMRRTLVARLRAYFEARAAAGLLRPVPHPEATARLVLENVAIFAMHRHHDPDAAGIDDDVARETVIDLVVHALLWPEAPARAVHAKRGPRR